MKEDAKLWHSHHVFNELWKAAVGQNPDGKGGERLGMSCMGLDFPFSFPSPGYITKCLFVCRFLFLFPLMSPTQLGRRGNVCF